MRSAANTTLALTISPLHNVRNGVRSVINLPGSPRRHLALGAVLAVALVAQSIALIAQQIQIEGLQTQPIGFKEHLEPGPSGPSGPSGPPGPDGEIGPPGKDGADGQDGQDGQDGHEGKDGTDGQDAMAQPEPSCPSSDSKR